MSETFIKIDSLQHLKISRQTYPTNRSKICVTTFTVLTLCYFFQNNARYTYLLTSTFQFEFIASFESKTLTILTLKCTSHGYMYCIVCIVTNLHTIQFTLQSRTLKSVRYLNFKLQPFPSLPKKKSRLALVFRLNRRVIFFKKMDTQFWVFFVSRVFSRV